MWGGLEWDRPKPNRNLEVDGEGRSRQHQKTILNRKLEKSAILKTQTAQTVLETNCKPLNFKLWQVSGKGLWILCPEKGGYTTVSELKVLQSRKVEKLCNLLTPQERK